MARRSLAFRLLVWILPIVVTVIAASSYAIYKAAGRIVIEELERGVAASNAVVAAQVASFFRQRRSEILTLSESPLFKDHYMNVEYQLDAEARMNAAAIEEMLHRFSHRTGVYSRIAYADSAGRIVTEIVDSDPVRTRRPALDAELLKEIRGLPPGTLSVSDPFTSEGTVADTIHYRAALRGPSGTPRGVLLFDCGLNPVSEALQGIRHGASSTISTRRMPAPTPPPRRAGSRVVAASFIPGTPWEIVTSVDYAELLQKLGALAAWTLLFAGVAALLTVLLVAARVRVLLAPLTRLAEAVRGFGKGDPLERVTVEGPAEIASLAADFDAMSRNLARQTDRLRRSELQYRTAVEQSPNAVVNLDRERRITLWNRRATAVFGYESTDAVGRRLSLVLDPKEEARLFSSPRSGSDPEQFDVRATRKDGRTLDLVASVSPGTAEAETVGEWFVVLEDVTERKRLQESLIQSEKMTVIGNLVAGIAHELNNPLAAVAGFAELLSDLPGSADEKEDLRHLHSSALRCRDIVQELLRFVRRETAQLRRISVNEAVNAALALMEYRIVKSEGIALELRLDPGNPSAGADFAKLQQILVNLLSNAVDALQKPDGPRLIRISTRSRDDGVEIAVEDSGTGVCPQAAPRVFEPFVTTKSNGKGTGLGLALSKQYARSFSGDIVFDRSELGGARFTLSLPECPESLEDAEHTVDLPPPVRGKRVLVVDDDAEVARLMVRMLQEDGIEAEGFEDPEKAFARIGETGFDLVVSDVDMGAVKGAEFRARVRAKAGELPFIFATGNVLNPERTEEISRCGAPLLAKPFLRSEFIRAVRRELSKRPNGRRPSA